MSQNRLFGLLLATILCQCIAAKAPKGMLPLTSWVMEDLTEAGIKASIAEHPGDDILGIWQTTSDGTYVAAIEGSVPQSPRSFGKTILFVMLRSPQIGLQTGTVMGYCTPAAKKGYYNCQFYTKHQFGTLTSPKNFYLKLNDDNHLSLVEVHEGVEISVWRMLPYLWCRGIRVRHDRPADLDGMIRHWPLEPGSYVIYL